MRVSPTFLLLVAIQLLLTVALRANILPTTDVMHLIVVFIIVTTFGLGVLAIYKFKLKQTVEPTKANDIEWMLRNEQLSRPLMEDSAYIGSVDAAIDAYGPMSDTDVAKPDAFGVNIKRHLGMAAEHMLDFAYSCVGFVSLAMNEVSRYSAISTGYIKDVFRRRQTLKKAEPRTLSSYEMELKRQISRYDIEVDLDVKENADNHPGYCPPLDQGYCPPLDQGYCPPLDQGYCPPLDLTPPPPKEDKVILQLDLICKTLNCQIAADKKKYAALVPKSQSDSRLLVPMKAQV